ncbi:MAG: hypothetical protein C0P72_010695 [Clostridia bacterium]
MPWLKFNKVTKIVQRLSDLEEEMAEEGMRSFFLKENEAVIWADKFEDEHERRTRERVLEKRIEGLRQAVKRWRIKAGVDAPEEDPILIKAEVAKKKGEWFLFEHYALPVEKNVALIYEAREFLITFEGFEIEEFERLYFDERHGWVAVFCKSSPDWDLSRLKNRLLNAQN